MATGMSNRAASSTCRIFTLLLFVLLWIVAWYTSQMTSNFSPIRPRYYSSSSSSSKIVKAAPVWEVQQDTLTLTDELIGEVVNELEKVRENKNGPGSSTMVKTNEAESGTMVKPQVLQPVGRSLHTLLLQNVARVSMLEFSAVGIVSVDLRRQQGVPVHSCAWVSRASLTTAATLAASNHSSVLWGSTTVKYVNESLDADYDVTVVRCGFEDPVGANSEGGVLLLNVTSRKSSSFEFVPVFGEGPEELNAGPFPYDYAFCTPPIFHRNMSSKHVEEWLAYHRGIFQGRKIHFFVYDAGGIHTGLGDVFKPLKDAGLLTVVDLREALRFGLSQHGHLLAINDCLHRCRFAANWAFFWDFDEYLQVLDPSVSSMDELLQKYENKPWISLGSMLWSRTYCDVLTDGRWDVERMNFRLAFPTCGDENRANFCHGVEGQRKWIANPREVFLGTIFRTLDPEWNGQILDASVARLNHFKELVLADSSSNCWILKNVGGIDASTPVDGWWWKDLGFAQVAREARLRGP